MPFEKHPSFLQPNPDQILWRYIDLARFVSLMQKSALFFPTLGKLATIDPWEGMPSKLNFADNRRIAVQVNDGINSRIEEMTFEQLYGSKEAARNAQKLPIDHAKKQLYVNCWHMNDSESDSQWKTYGNNYASLAIVSDYKSIISSITDTKIIFGGTVQYYNPKVDVTNVDNFLLHTIYKRHAFSHEREFRLIYWNLIGEGKGRPIGVDDPGQYIKVELNKLIKGIVVSPLAPNWFVETVTELISNHGLVCGITKSELAEIREY
jgi:hypothetical protein